MLLGKVLVKDTFAEIFKMPYTRVLVTADEIELLEYALQSLTGFATSIILCPCEAGVETYLNTSQTPDNRPGAAVMIFAKDKETLKKELDKRLSQCVLTSPTASVFNGLDIGEPVNTGRYISYFGDGWQRKENRYGKDVWIIPMMDGEFVIEESFKIGEGAAGGNFIIIAGDKKSGLNAARKAVREIHKTPYVITPFPGGICRSGSKPGSLKYKGLPASINHRFYPTIRNLVADTELPDGASTVYEIVINGGSLKSIEEAMGRGIVAAAGVEGVLEITAANYDGKLGDGKIYLKNVLEDVVNL
ncbi:MAG: formylmethanofuran--tetrahydromethanopterin N-formyltransferase [Candidatus Odinarchaeum yellowstonii]|uniref:Formylmethanofuran--tetrahydromethanopterin N-formyltransferase n=1 Tax=Odinarchaeota yellowstonii (strain LCB_4) TaxID=1841599 RepID=A0AAF0IAN5_ODILC|nr:MAG: formylmethanofuran--tetrahydromethanopterin N-formyltransferase [Candidatus Odinarchaeum yellowstonii]